MAADATSTFEVSTDSRVSGQRRRISEITGMENDVITMQDIFVFRRRGRTEDGKIVGEYMMTGIRPKFAEALSAAGIEVDNKDISLVGRIIANFPDALTPEQRIPDELTRLGELARR